MKRVMPHMGERLFFQKKIFVSSQFEKKNEEITCDNRLCFRKKERERARERSMCTTVADATID